MLAVAAAAVLENSSCPAICIGSAENRQSVIFHGVPPAELVPICIGAFGAELTETLKSWIKSAVVYDAAVAAIVSVVRAKLYTVFSPDDVGVNPSGQPLTVTLTPVTVPEEKIAIRRPVSRTMDVFRVTTPAVEMLPREFELAAASTFDT